MSNLLEINTNLQEIIFNFGGFYDSNHLTIIESNLDSTLDNIDIEKIKEFKKDQLFNFEITKMNYTKALLKLIDDKFNTNFLECFKQVWSPKEYNFITDQIILDYKNFSLIRTFYDNFSLKFCFKDNETINKIEAFLKNIENYSDLEFEIAFFKLDNENLKKFIDDNLNLDNEILDTILDNFENIKQQNFCDLEEFKQYLIEVYDSQITYYYTAFEFLKIYDSSLKKSLNLANDLGLELKNLDVEILASLLKEDIFRDAIKDSNEDLKIIFELIQNQ